MSVPTLTAEQIQELNRVAGQGATALGSIIGQLIKEANKVAAFASQAEAEAGVATDKLMSPARTAQAIAAQVVNPFTYKGAWNAATNTPELADGVGTSGETYRVTHAGSVDFGAGAISFAVGDKAVYNGTLWEKWDVQDDDVPVVTAPASVTPVFTGFGTVSGVTAYTWRVGAMLHFEITFTSGTSTADEARIGLRYNPGGGEVDVTTASTYPTTQLIGNVTYNSAAATSDPVSVLAQASKTYVTFGLQQTGSSAGLNPNIGTQVTVSGWRLALKGSVRIQGW